MDNKKYENLSKAGKNSVKKYLYLLSKKEKRKFDFNDLFYLKEKNENNPEDNESYFYNEDIFNKTYEKKISEKERKKKGKIFKIKSACSSLNKKKNTENEFIEIRNNIINNSFGMKYDKYKYHLLHHNDKYENIFIKKKNNPSSTKYQPKYEYIYRKLIYSIPFKKMSGRQNKILFKKFKEKAKEQLKTKFLNHLTTDKNHISPLNNQSLRQLSHNHSELIIKNKKNNKNVTKIENIGSVSKQKNNIRQDSSNSISNNYLTNNEIDSTTKRINLEKKQSQVQPIKKVKNQKNDINNIKSNEKIEKKLNSSPKHILRNVSNYILSPYKTYEKKDNTNNNSLAILNEENLPDLDINKNGVFKQTIKYKGINFKKMLSREYLNKITSSKEPMHPMVTPNYSLVEPKTIMKVLYSKSCKNEDKKHIIAYNNDYTYDINNIFNKYNNHHYPKQFNLSKMCGRFENEKNELPLFMLRSYFRNSIDNLNESSLKMNNFSNGTFQEVQSSFKEKKTFNVRLKLEEIKKENKIMEYNCKNNMLKIKNKTIKYLDEKKEKSEINFILKNTWWKKRLGEFYKKDYDELGNKSSSSFIGSKVDGITFKLYKTNSKYKNLLNKKEKEIFCPF